MRQDDTVAESGISGAEAWKTNPRTGERDEEMDSRMFVRDEIVDGKLRVHSLSGHERNKLFVNEGGKQFSDLSGLSGLDDAADSRSFALLDYDRDGWQDIVLVNAGNPLTRIYHNELKTQGRTGSVVALRFVGGNDGASKSDWSNRDGYGARVELRRGKEVIEREHRCGDGYASQNSATLLVGIGDWDEVDEISVRWPSGKSSKTGKVGAGSLVTIFERGDLEISDYLKQMPERRERAKRLPLFPVEGKGSRLTIWMGMATWCPACARHLPQARHLARQLKDDGVTLVGFPLDEAEGEEVLLAYADEHDTGYELLAKLEMEQRKVGVGFLKEILKVSELSLPTSWMTNQEGKVVWVGSGLPTVSEVRKTLLEDE